MKKIDIVIPLFNEEDIIPRLVNTLKQLFEQHQVYLFHFIFINDGSRDNTARVLEDEITKTKLSYETLHLARNFGHQAAITAGINHSSGNACVTIDGDLQDPPIVIFDFIQEWEKGNDIIYAKRKSRAGESFFKLITASLFYRVIHKITNVEIPQDTGDFRLIDKKVVCEFQKLPEKNRFVRGLIPWLGFKSSFVEFAREKRSEGKTKYSLKHMIKLASDGMLSFSYFPLRICTYVGFFITLCSFIFSIKIIVDRLYFKPGLIVDGWTSVMIAILFIGGMQFLFLGVIGEYIGRIFDEVKSRPNYIISHINSNKE